MRWKKGRQFIKVINTRLPWAWPALVVGCASVIMLFWMISNFKPAAPLQIPDVNKEVGECTEDYGPLDTALYGSVAAEQLPWAQNVPAELQRLRSETEATRLLATFRTTLPTPLFDEVANIATAAGYLAGTVINPGAGFRLVPTIGPYTAERGYLGGPMYSGGRIVTSMGGGVCKVATTMYNVAIAAGLRVTERHQHSMPVPYVPAGRDAAIAWGYKDLAVRNPFATPVVLWAQFHDDTLYMAMYGSHEPPVVQWHHEELGRVAAPVIRRANDKLDPGEEEVISEGYDGVTVRTWLIVTHADGGEERQDLGVDQYRPLPRVVEYGPRR